MTEQDAKDITERVRAVFELTWPFKSTAEQAAQAHERDIAELSVHEPARD
jgi:hypothetical protein